MVKESRRGRDAVERKMQKLVITSWDRRKEGANLGVLRYYGDKDTLQDSVWVGKIRSIKCYLILKKVDARGRSLRITVLDLIESTFKKAFFKKSFGNSKRMTSKRERKFSR